MEVGFSQMVRAKGQDARVDPLALAKAKSPFNFLSPLAKASGKLELANLVSETR